MMPSNKGILIVALLGAVAGAAAGLFFEPNLAARLAGTGPGQRVLGAVLEANAPAPPAGVIVARRGDIVPAMTLTALDGSRVPVPQAWAGKTTLVNFWASWCAPCLKEMPELQAFADNQSANARKAFADNQSANARKAFADDQSANVRKAFADNQSANVRKAFADNQSANVRKAFADDQSANVRKAFATDQPSNGLQVVGIALDEAAPARTMIQRLGITYANLIEAPGPADASVRMGNPAGVLPYSVLISPDGRVLRTKIGPFEHVQDIENWSKP